MMVKTHSIKWVFFLGLGLVVVHLEHGDVLHVVEGYQVFNLVAEYLAGVAAEQQGALIWEVVHAT